MQYNVITQEDENRLKWLVTDQIRLRIQKEEGTKESVLLKLNSAIWELLLTRKP